MANFYLNGECFLQILSGLVVLTKRSEQCSQAYVTGRFCISVDNFYVDSNCFFQILSGLVILTKQFEQ